MKRTFTAMFTIGLVAGVLFAPASAQAASTCTTHKVFVDGWSEQIDTIGYSAEFKCGGSTSDYRIHVFMQLRNPNGDWATDVCQTGPCDVYKPGSGASDWWANGTLHAVTGSFSSNHDIDNLTYRFRVVVKFRNGSPDIAYNSQSQVV